MFDERTLRVLEYEQVKQLLLRHASSSLGKERVAAMLPHTRPQQVAALQEETDQARLLVEAERSLSLGGIRDVRAQVRRAAKGAVLEPSDLLDIAGTYHAARRLRAFLAARADQYPVLGMKAERLATFQEIEDEIHRALDEKGEVLDRASKELAAVRQRIRSVHGSLISRLESLLRSPEFARMAQEPIITIRSERFCIPVRSQYKSALRGIVHDTSASGATIFMEPLAVVELNNEYIQAKRQEQEEVRRVLAFLSGLVGGRAADAARTLDALGDLDFIFARARCALEMSATRPLLSSDGYLALRQARHPLLGEQVVPIDVELGGEFVTLIITGPNTGGKTVSLKTVGLLTLMAQSGLQVPADEGSRLSIFRQVFADIGDEQSIQQSLSTFSSHISQITRIMEHADGRSLVLLDEIGAGTDPAEGSALAKAILEELHARGARTIATTHYGELKAFAYSSPGVQNAHVEFDTVTLSPTFKLRIGVPGSSNAFAISERLGMPPHVVEVARRLLGSGQTALEDAIRAVEESQRELAQRRGETELLHQDAQKLLQRQQERLERLEAQRDKIIAEAHAQAERLLNQTREQAASLLEELKQRSKQRSPRPDTPAQAARQVREQMATAQTRLEQAQPAPREKPAPAPRRRPGLRTVKLGETVYLPEVGTHGQVLALPDEGGQVELQVGLLKMKLPLHQLERSRLPEVTFSPGALAAAREPVPPELMLRGLPVDEAAYLLDRYLDDALRANLGQVRIIHGYGTGALKHAVHEALRQHPRVKGFRMGGRGEGGGGVTVATLD